MIFDHYLITRFNQAMSKSWNTPHSKLLDEVWLDRRRVLFEKYTKPSILSQTVRNFKYIMLFHPDTVVVSIIRNFSSQEPD